MKPSERAKALCDEFGILPTYEDYCKRAEAFIEAAERVAFEAAREPGTVLSSDIEVGVVKWATYADWQKGRDE